MVDYIHFRDPDSREIEEKLKQIPKCPGTCIFMDIVGSTKIKYSSALPQWGKRLNNTFNFISLLNDFPDNIVKGIGDEIMLFIPDEALLSKKSFNNHFALLEEIYATLFNIKHFPRNDLFLPCKVGIHYCTEVYNITFLEGFNDYYGKDIDMTARLMSNAQANRIVLSDIFYRKVIEDTIKMNLADSTGCLSDITEAQHIQYKGVPGTTGIRFLDVL